MAEFAHFILANHLAADGGGGGNHFIRWRVLRDLKKKTGSQNRKPTNGKEMVVCACACTTCVCRQQRLCRHHHCYKYDGEFLATSSSGWQSVVGKRLFQTELDSIIPGKEKLENENFLIDENGKSMTKESNCKRFKYMFPCKCVRIFDVLDGSTFHNLLLIFFFRFLKYVICQEHQFFLSSSLFKWVSKKFGVAFLLGW
jgi:hypothetical protein